LRRPTLARRPRRAANTLSLMRSAIDTRDIDALTPPLARALSSRRGRAP
jgi:hypothetical protein